MSGGSFDVWLLDFSESPNASEALQRWFGIDAASAAKILATMPRPVKRAASAAEAEEVAAALRILGAKVELRAAAPDVKTSGTDLVPQERKRARMASLHDTGGDAAKAPSVQPPPSSNAETLPEMEAAVAEPRLDLDAPLSGPPPARAVKASVAGAPRPAVKSSAAGAPRPLATPAAPAPAASLDPLDPFTAGGESLELVDVPKKEEAPKPAIRQGVDAEAIRRIEAQREAEENPEAAKEKARFKLPPMPPWLVRGVLIVVAGGALTYGLRAAGRSCGSTTAPTGAPMASLEERTIASAVDVQTFLARPDARLGINQSRNRALASILRTQGATRVLAADVAQVDGREVALTLVVELPSSPLRRRRVQGAVESYRTRSVVDPETVQVPGPEQRYTLIQLE